MLERVADDYIMKDAGKGVVPCEPDCGPAYQPPPAPEAFASYPPAELSCNTTSESLSCEAAPASSEANFTRGPPPPRPPPGPTCGVLTQAVATFRYTRTNGGCSAFACESQNEESEFTGSASLSPAISDNDTEGYEGVGIAQYRDSSDFEVTSNLRCSSSTNTGSTDGIADMFVHAYFSIDNTVTGGPDTSAMPADTTVVEVTFDGHGLHQQNYTKNGCDPPVSWSDDEGAAGLGCFFYGVDLYRGGYYVVDMDGDPKSGVCTLQLSR
jgi:hypothetical protein